MVAVIFHISTHLVVITALYEPLSCLCIGVFLWLIGIHNVMIAGLLSILHCLSHIILHVA